MLIQSGNLSPHCLSGKVAVVTGAGRGIGYEAARALTGLGAVTIIAEIDEETGLQAERNIRNEVARGKKGKEVSFFHYTDVSDEASVSKLKQWAIDRFGRVDIIINNATVTPMGAVKELPIQMWDDSYKVNLRGPVLLARAFLPEMAARDYGVIVCVGSVGHAFMGAYETFKTAQLHLAETLDAELEGTSVCALSISPGLVRTPGAVRGIEALAPLYGKTVEEFFALSEELIVSVETAGAGFAAAVVLAKQFRGQEISALQALSAAGISVERSGSNTADAVMSNDRNIPIQLTGVCREKAVQLIMRIRGTIEEQAEGWMHRSIFERQWMFRDFKKHAGMPVERWIETLRLYEAVISDVVGQEDRAVSSESPCPDYPTHTMGSNAPLPAGRPPLEQLAGFYTHLKQLAEGYEKDPLKKAAYAETIDGWRHDVEELIGMIDSM